MNEAKLKSVLPRLGNALRRYREKSGRTLGSVAEAAGISISMLSQIERGVVSPSIDTLVTVCGVLGIDAAELFRRVSPAAPVRIHKRRERLTIENDGVRYEQLMTSHAPPFTAELFLLEVAPAYATALSHAGHEGVEIGYVLAGCGLLTVGTEEHAITEGDSVCFDARLPHRLASTGKLAFKAVWSISPPHVDYLK